LDGGEQGAAPTEVLAVVESLFGGQFQEEKTLAALMLGYAKAARAAVTPLDLNRWLGLVLLNAPVRHSDEARYAELAFATIEALKAERPILITKAVSWLLRTLTERHRAAVSAYVEANAATLPAIAVREVRVKLATGTTSGLWRRAG
jgi:hypothetical protein